MNAYHNYLRWLYRGGRPGRFARLQNRMSAADGQAVLRHGRRETVHLREVAPAA